MKARWREHELILATMLAALALVIYLVGIFSVPFADFEKSMAEPFVKNNVPFNIYRNLLIPDIGMGILIYLAYLWISRFSFPRLVRNNHTTDNSSTVAFSFILFIGNIFSKKNIKRFIWFILQIIIISLILGTALNTATYYLHEWQFHYPGFSIFFKGYNPNSQINLPESYFFAFSMVWIYVSYGIVREVIIRFIERQDERRSFRVMILNQVTMFLALYVFLFPVGLVLFGVRFGGPLFALWGAMPSIVTLILVNIYWLFPRYGSQSFFNKALLLRLLIITFICTFPVPIFFGFKAIPPFFFLSWLFQLGIVTPLSWLFFNLGKDKIIQLRGLEKELVRSKTDLQFLRSQINPHFLFNALNTLYGTALREGSEQTAIGIQKLGDMMRFMLHENNLDFIPMSRELEYLENYISLQKLRTQASPGIVIEDNIQSQRCNHTIAPMLLIPFVENAFKHGISLNEPSWIKIKLVCDKDYIHFEVRNSIHLLPDNDTEKKGTGIGLANLGERLKLLYPGKNKLLTEGNRNEFTACLTINVT